MKRGPGFLADSDWSQGNQYIPFFGLRDALSISLEELGTKRKIASARWTEEVVDSAIVKCSKGDLHTCRVWYTLPEFQKLIILLGERCNVASLRRVYGPSSAYCP